MRALAAAMTILLCLWAPAAADANVLCRWTGICVYLSPGFKVTVVDGQTGQPLSEVYGWAEWTQYGAHGRGGPLMVQDATSNGAGYLTFPHWGPTLGSAGGLVLGIDPAVIFFKPGYATLLVQNGVPLGASHHRAIRGFSHSGETLHLQPFRGSPVEWVDQLRRLVFPALSYGSTADAERFRTEYLRRLERVADQLKVLTLETAESTAFRSSVELEHKYVTGARR